MRRPSPRLALVGVSCILCGCGGQAGASSSSKPPPGMVRVPGGAFTMGSNDPDAWPGEGPARAAHVEAFWLDRHEVTNAQFRAFVEATGHVTTAEQVPRLDELLAQLPPETPPPPPEALVPGSIVFVPPPAPIPLDDSRAWWRWTPGASWRHPEGPGSDLRARDDHPVVHVSWDDAAAYARWAGKRLPSEREWERAARGGLEGRRYVWGDQPPGPDAVLANLWQGAFPAVNSQEDGFARTAPVGTFPPNGYDLHDMAGNVWEWCADWFDARRGLRLQKGGSFLCSDQYCTRYRPAARHGSAPDTGTSHVGFRCAWSPPTR